MKKIIKTLTDFIRDDFNFWVYTISILCLVVAIWYNYSIDFEDSMIDPLQKKWYGFFVYLLYFGIPYFFVIVLSLAIENRKYINRGFWLISIFAIALLSFKSWFHFSDQLLPSSWFDNYYLRYKISNRISNVIIYTIGISLFYHFYERYNKNWYGMKADQFTSRPYLILLACMIPLLVWASLQPDFLASYPRLNPEHVPQHYLKWFLLFEPLYLFEFVTLEWFFRGFLILGTVHFLGKRAVLPMAVLYCVFHFGKPLGECIGSFFGGYILGVVSYESKSVWGGILVHIGIALLMDLFALNSIYVLGN